MQTLNYTRAEWIAMSLRTLPELAGNPEQIALARVLAAVRWTPDLVPTETRAMIDQLRDTLPPEVRASHDAELLRLRR